MTTGNPTDRHAGPAIPPVPRGWRRIVDILAIPVFMVDLLVVFEVWEILKQQRGPDGDIAVGCVALPAAVIVLLVSIPLAINTRRSWRLFRTLMFVVSLVPALLTFVGLARGRW